MQPLTTKLQVPNPRIEGKDALMWRLELIHRYTDIEFDRLVTDVRNWKRKREIDLTYWSKAAASHWPDHFDVALLFAKSLLDVRDEVSFESYNYLSSNKSKAKC